eukprot:gene390-431_t
MTATAATPKNASRKRSLDDVSSSATKRPMAKRTRHVSVRKRSVFDFAKTGFSSTPPPRRRSSARQSTVPCDFSGETYYQGQPHFPSPEAVLPPPLFQSRRQWARPSSVGTPSTKASEGTCSPDSENSFEHVASANFGNFSDTAEEWHELEKDKGERYEGPFHKRAGTIH